MEDFDVPLCPKQLNGKASGSPPLDTISKAGIAQLARILWHAVEPIADAGRIEMKHRRDTSAALSKCLQLRHSQISRRDEGVAYPIFCAQIA